MFKDKSYSNVHSKWLTERDLGKHEREPISNAKSASKATIKYIASKGFKGVAANVAASQIINNLGVKAYKDMKNYLSFYEGKELLVRMAALAELGVNLEKLNSSKTNTHNKVLSKPGVSKTNKNKQESKKENKEVIQALVEYEAYQQKKKRENKEGERIKEVKLTEKEKQELLARHNRNKQPIK